MFVLKFFLHIGISKCHNFIFFQLTEMGIDYDEPNLDERINSDLVINLKQLLMFAVQISYGLVSVTFVTKFHLSYLLYIYTLYSCKKKFIVTQYFMDCKKRRLIVLIIPDYTLILLGADIDFHLNMNFFRNILVRKVLCIVM